MEIPHFKVTTDLHVAKSSGQFSIFILLDLSAALDTANSLLFDTLLKSIPWALNPPDFPSASLVALSQFALFIPCLCNLFLWGYSWLHAVLLFPYEVISLLITPNIIRL